MYGIDSSWIFALLSLVIGTEEEIAGLDSELGGEGIPSLPSLESPHYSWEILEISLALFQKFLLVMLHGGGHGFVACCRPHLSSLSLSKRLMNDGRQEGLQIYCIPTRASEMLLATPAASIKQAAG
jgi:hypothetical protein